MCSARHYSAFLHWTFDDGLPINWHLARMTPESELSELYNEVDALEPSGHQLLAGALGDLEQLLIDSLRDESARYASD